MLEIRYDKGTKVLTGWWSSRLGNHKGKLKNRPNEAIVKLDIPIPDKPLGAWLCDGENLAPNPNYIEPLPSRDLAKEVDEINERLATLEKM